MTQSVTDSGTRGPADHNVRDQIVEAAMQHFAHYGYEKTTVSDLARAIGFSKAYIYKFFESKQAIGEVICSNRLAMIMERAETAIADAPGASEQLRRLFQTLSATSTELFFHERKLYDIAAVASRDRWPSAMAYEKRILNLIQQILRRGREMGEFERKTPADDAAEAIYRVIRPYVSPVLLQYSLDEAEAASTQLAALVLRSLAP
ncbi:MULTISPECIES: TetR/AcrR family transcriptional regulator [Pantoea]|jgi:AcrR family transcriptional regulator|uniref:TetR/AcrR family transcriptional regulator n=1 Tax=Pantoea vagans TaxID=470934 RepID=A0AAN1NV91_9GAMM|nr:MULTISPECIES: TetR/AcrR family transcriptional regulator [Pantoea]ADO07934.1 HTH-type transcriptional regulator luxR [Pantoea vagans C9-1]AVV39888.1 TetR/AcrR family transcriptional regulator [Pantoea vagans]QCA06811.1 TetR/AcrR family transcriptional regulator [Pantoea vagans]